MTDRRFRRWSIQKLAERLLMYTGYIGCGCYSAEHDDNSPICARADFWRIARELHKRLSPLTPPETPKRRRTKRT